MATRAFAYVAASVIATAAIPQAASAWGDEGHETIGLVAEHYLTPAEKAEVDRLLALPIELQSAVPATMRDRATWADKYRDSDRNSTKIRYNLTHNWHFVDLAIDQPNMTTACFGDHALPPGANPSEQTADECVVQKIEEFTQVLANKSLPDADRAKALTFLLHFVGDIHQPLHAAERNDDHGGNLVYIVIGKNKNGSNLHSYWDTATVKRLGSTPEALSGALISDISASDLTAWRTGGPRDWAMESYQVAHDAAYRLPSQHRNCTIRDRTKPPRTEDCTLLDQQYQVNAAGRVHHQLEVAGVRLAWVISQALK